jgi:hypothetical protein
MEQDTQTSLPNGSSTVSGLEKIISESTETLAEAAAPKRPRGRPFGWRKEGSGAQGGQAQDPKPGATIHGEVVKINEIEPLATEIVKAPFDFAGWKAGIDITPTEEEAKAPARYLSKLIECYLPDLESKDPKIFAWVAFAISYALLGVKKLRIILANKPKAKNETQKTVVNDKGETVVTPREPILPATSYAPDQFFGGSGL